LLCIAEGRLLAQSEAAKIMAEALKNGPTCIDCHKGIAHHLPKEEANGPDELSSPLIFAGQLAVGRRSSHPSAPPMP
jgi:hypothetical protein